MANLYLYWLVLLIAVFANCAEIGDIVEPEEIDPLEVLDEANDKQRDERDIFGLFSKPKKVAEPKIVASTYANTKTGYGFKTGSGSSGSYGGYGSSPGSGYGGNRHGGYGYKTGHNHDYKHGWENHISNTAKNDYLQNVLNQGLSNSQRTKEFLINARKQLPMFGECHANILPPNVQYSCQNNQCEVFCPPMYTFPDGKTSLKLVCIGRDWIVRDSVYLEVPPCQATCNPPCQNNGICIESGLCKCSENFSGPLCQYKKSVCASKVPMPKNSKITCINNVCNAECMRGFRFPDGSSITNIECRNGQWVHTKSGLQKPPDCGPICDPPCENAGQCISFNVCQCSMEYRGDHCQYSVAACNVTKANFNGNYKCSYDSELAKCSFSCAEVPGLKVDGRLDIEYKCKYSEGEFRPSPLPKCIYPAGYTIRQGSKTSQLNQYKKQITLNGGGRYDHQYLTDHERIVAILAKFKDYDVRSQEVTPGSTEILETSKKEALNMKAK